MDTENAIITDTMLGQEDHGILTCCLTLKATSGTFRFGGYQLDHLHLSDSKGKTGRIGTAFGMEFVRRVMEVAGVDSWEKLKGIYIRIDVKSHSVVAIRHIIEDKYFRPEDDPVLLRLVGKKEMS
ncbi:hypothetical protein OH491_13685 [Termitidicoccus mucosus]|uniref:Uncharacterized protein n=1 Tax=Termitidicoccus mucosus TaxID=1184151 RepID=A0A178IH40_9BACT|nr:hypothetical protein AW736_13765 [Opitutaceae bacterium TSB47]